MKDFNRFYLWGVNTKYSMGLYFSAAVFVKGLVNVLMENWTIDVIILLEMLLACFAFACLESARLGCAGQCHLHRLRLGTALVPRPAALGRTAAGPFPGVRLGRYVVRPVPE